MTTDEEKSNWLIIMATIRVLSACKLTTFEPLEKRPQLFVLASFGIDSGGTTIFCHQCGAEAKGNFCSSCGTSLKGEPVSKDWSEETNYSHLIANPAVQDLIKQHGALAKNRLSGEEFLSLASNLLPVNIPLETVAKFAVPFYSKLGLKTGKRRSKALIGASVGKVIVATLCSFAKNGQSLQEVKQLDNGCLLEAKLPSDMFAFVGTLYVTIGKEEQGITVDAATHIPGQLYDWGKSKRCLDRLFSDLNSNSGIQD